MENLRCVHKRLHNNVSMTPPRSDHFNGKTFFNPGPRAERGLLDALRWKFTSRPARWPHWVDIVPQAPPPAPRDGGVAATWINHATFLLQTGQHALLTDPVFSERASPVSWAGPRRVHVPGVAFASLPKIDFVLLSHDHYDHCDLPSLRRLAHTHQPLFLAPLGHCALLAGAGATRIVELDWWQSHALAPNLMVRLTPARHWCRRTPGGTNRRLWGGFYLRTAARSVWFAGDTGYDETLFRDIGRRCGAPDLALIPIGAYEPRWFMQTAHMNPAEAVRAHRDCGARQSIAMHWGTFQLTDEGREEPVQALELARVAAGLGLEEFRVLLPGRHVVI
jgi:L-ascorbate metabolism protein UlaG (beta-lactamase superfamily)